MLWIVTKPPKMVPMSDLSEFVDHIVLSSLSQPMNIEELAVTVQAKPHQLRLVLKRLFRAGKIRRSRKNNTLFYCKVERSSL